MPQHYPPKVTPTSKPQTRPFKLPKHLYKDCVLALFGERNNKWLDRSKNKNKGIFHGPVWKSDGIRGPALFFDGIDDYIEFPLISDYAKGKMTFCFWLKTSHSSGFAQIFAIQGQDEFEGFSIERLIPKMHFGNYNYKHWEDNSALYYDDKWHFWVLYVPSDDYNDGDDIILEIDNTLQEIDASQLWGTYDPWIAFDIGKTRTRALDGSIDMFLMFNRELTTLEKKQLYNITKPQCW